MSTQLVLNLLKITDVNKILQHRKFNCIYLFIILIVN